MTVSASVIVAVHSSTDELSGLLRCLAKQDFYGPIHVLVVDNHRQPHVASLLGTDISAVSVTVIHEPRPGVSRARNTGVRHASGDYLLFTDPDARPDATWVRTLISALLHSGAYCAGGRIVPRFVEYDTPPAIDPGVEQLFVPDVWPAQTCSLQEPFWLAGCNLAVRSSPPPIFDEYLGARPRRHLSCEDLELTHRATRDGLGVMVVPDAVVHRAIHRRDLRLGALLARGWWHGVSVARMQQRHPDVAIYDTAHARGVLRMFSRSQWSTMSVHLARVAGWRLESTRLTLTGHGRRLPGHAAEVVGS